MSRKLKRTFAATKPVASSRRTFLRSTVGGFLALPFLESLAPSTAHAAPGDKKRLLYWFLPNGFFMPAIIPGDTGTGYTLSPSLSPLAPHRDDLLVVSGLSNYGAIAGGEGHDPGTAAFLSCAATNPDFVQNDISVDQIAANTMVGVTPFASLEASMENGSGVGGCGGAVCGYGSNISWVNTTTPRARSATPTALFNRLFGSLNPSLTPEEQTRQRELRLSVLDRAVGHANELMGKLGSADKQKLDHYLTSVRELETQVDSLSTAVCEPGDPPAEDLDFEPRMQAFTDLIVLALQCDLTRVASFMLGNGATNRSYEHIGIPESHHGLSHHGHDPAIHEKLELIDAWNMQHVVGYVIDKLKTTMDDDGNPLFDSTTLYVGSELADGHYHDNFDMLALVAGNSSALNLGQHISTSAAAVADLHLACLESFGVVETSLGHSGTAPLAGVLK